MDRSMANSSDSRITLPEASASFRYHAATRSPGTMRIQEDIQRFRRLGR
jgi:hypothetical protein